MRKITNDRFIYRERSEARRAANYQECAGDAAFFDEPTRRPPGFSVQVAAKGPVDFKVADGVGLATPAALGTQRV